MVEIIELKKYLESWLSDNKECLKEFEEMDTFEYGLVMGETETLEYILTKL